METTFLQQIQHEGLSAFFANWFGACFLVGFLFALIIVPACRDLVMFVSCRIRQRDRSGHQVHRDHVDVRLETLQ